jgi:hypothetical protein
MKPQGTRPAAPEGYVRNDEAATAGRYKSASLYAGPALQRPTGSNRGRSGTCQGLPWLPAKVANLKRVTGAGLSGGAAAYAYLVQL